MEIITKAKKSCTAFEKLGPRKHGRSVHQKSVTVHLKELFTVVVKHCCNTYG